MKYILTNEENFVYGPFNEVTQESDGYICDGTIYFTVITGPVVESEVPDDYQTPQELEMQAEANKATATQLLQATDWTTIADVGNPQTSNPYLANQSAFIQYRNAVRQYAVYPTPGNINWPTLPTEDWVKV